MGPAIIFPLMNCHFVKAVSKCLRIQLTQSRFVLLSQYIFTQVLLKKINILMLTLMLLSQTITVFSSKVLCLCTKNIQTEVTSKYYITETSVTYSFRLFLSHLPSPG